MRWKLSDCDLQEAGQDGEECAMCHVGQQPGNFSSYMDGEFGQVVDVEPSPHSGVSARYLRWSSNARFWVATLAR